MFDKPQAEHEWLHQLIGEWTMESECSMGPDQPPMKTKGTETVHSFGGLWTRGESEGEIPGGGTCKNVMTLGFDAKKNRFVGTFIGSVMTHLWIYEGTLDEGKKQLTLDTSGPSFAGDGAECRYQDIIEIVSPDHRILRSRMLVNDQWVDFMKADYHRIRKSMA